MKIQDLYGHQMKTKDSHFENTFKKINKNNIYFGKMIIQNYYAIILGNEQMYIDHILAYSNNWIFTLAKKSWSISIWAKVRHHFIITIKAAFGKVEFSSRTRIIPCTALWTSEVLLAATQIFQWYGIFDIVYESFYQVFK